MKFNRIGVLMLVIILTSLIPAAMLTVKADSNTFYVPEGINAPNSLYSGYWDESGQLITYRIITPIIRTGNYQDTIGGIIFPNLDGIDQNDLINNATLRLYFDSDLETASDNPSMSVWTYAYPVEIGTTLSDFDYNSFVLGGRATNVDLTNITSAQWVNIDVTLQLQQLVNNFYWESGKGICFLIYAVPHDTARSYQSNVGLNIPELFIEYETPPTGEGGESFVKQYRNYTIWNASRIPEPLIFAVDVDSGSDLLCVSNGSYINYVNPLPDDIQEFSEDPLLYLNETIYYASSEAGRLYIHRSTDYGQNWVNVSDNDYLNHTYDNWAGWGHILHNPIDNCIEVLWCDVNYDLYSTQYHLNNDSFAASDRAFTNLYTRTPQYSMQCDSEINPYTGDLFVLFIGQTSAADTTFDWDYASRLNGTWRSLRTEVSGNARGGAIVYPRGNETSKFLMSTYGILDYYYHWNQTDYTLTTNWADQSSIYSLGGSFNEGHQDLMEDENTSRIYFLTTSDTTYLARSAYIDSPYGYVNWTVNPSNNHYDTLAYLRSRLVRFNETVNSLIGLENNGYTVFFAPMSWWESSPHDQTAWDQTRLLWNNGSVAVFPDMNEIFCVRETGMLGSGGFVVKDDNDTIVNTPCLAAATTIEEVEACLDDLIGDDPVDPSGWEETPYFTRNKMKLYFLIAGILLVVAPWFYYALVLKGFMKFIYIWIILFLNVIGLAILWHIPSL